MDAADLELLDSPTAQELLASLPPYDPPGALALGERLRSAGHPAALVSAVLTQSRLRTRVRQRWGSVVDQLVFTPEGAEQATRPVVAAHRAQRLRDGGLTTVADLGCGIGLDAIAFAQHGLQVLAIDRDAATCAAAAMNVQALGLADRVTVRCADVRSLPVTELVGQVDAAFADPARRSNGRRLAHPEEWSPPLSWVLGLPFEHLAVKVAPGLAHDLVPAGHQFEVVSVDGDVVEAGLYRGRLRPDASTRRATLLPGGHTTSDLDLPSAPPPVGPVGGYLFEPDGAMIRAGLVANLVAEVNGRLLDPHIAYVTSDEDMRSVFATRYTVTDVLPFSVKRLRELLRHRGAGSVTIKKRGFAAEPETLRRQLRLDRRQPGSATIVLTRVGQEPLALLVEPER